MLSSESDGSIKAQLCTSAVVRGKLVLPLSRHLIGQPQSDTESLAIAPQVSTPFATSYRVSLSPFHRVRHLLEIDVHSRSVRTRQLQIERLTAG